MKTQFRQAGIRIHELAVLAAQAHPKDRAAARKQLEADVFADLALLLNYTEWAHQEAARRVLEVAYKEIRAGRTVRDTHSVTASPGADRVQSDTQPPPVRADTAAGQRSSDTHSSGARSGSFPVVTESMKKVVHLSIMDTFHITERQGSRTSIGNVPVHRMQDFIDGYGRRSWVTARERELFVFLKGKIGPIEHLQPGTKIRDVLQAQDIHDAVATVATMHVDLPAVDVTVKGFEVIERAAHA